MKMTDIMSVGDWKNNAEMFVDVAKLGYLDGDVLDLTYGLGRFWRLVQPSVLIKNDIDPERGDFHYDFTRDVPEGWLGAFDAVVLDPPYKFSGTRTVEDHNDSYGVTGAYVSPKNIEELYGAGIKFAWQCLAPKGLLLVKSQSQIVSGDRNPLPFKVWAMAQTYGFKMRDEFQLKTRPRPQPKGRKQKSARSNVSSLLVFTKVGS